MKKLVIVLSSVIAVYSCNKSKKLPYGTELKDPKDNALLTNAKQKPEPDPKTKSRFGCM